MPARTHGRHRRPPVSPSLSKLGERIRQARKEAGLTQAQLDRYRRETGGQGLSSYPHPWLMPQFWQFPTGSMGLGPLNAIYQARFMRYLEQRGVLETQGRKVWAFPGDGEMDEPESLAGLSIAAREGLDNLIFVVNCNWKCILFFSYNLFYVIKISSCRMNPYDKKALIFEFLPYFFNFGHFSYAWPTPSSPKIKHYNFSF